MAETFKPATVPEIREQERLVQELEARLAAHKGQTKELSGRIDRAQAELRRLIRGQDPRLFDGDSGEPLED